MRHPQILIIAIDCENKMDGFHQKNLVCFGGRVAAAPSGDVPRRPGPAAALQPALAGARRPAGRPGRRAAAREGARAPVLPSPARPGKTVLRVPFPLQRTVWPIWCSLVSNPRRRSRLRLRFSSRPKRRPERPLAPRSSPVSPRASPRACPLSTSRVACPVRSETRSYLIFKKPTQYIRWKSWKEPGKKERET